MKPRLLILSDLFGGNPEWINYYVKELESKFDIQYYNVLELGNIAISNNSSESNIHNQFLNGGIDKAVDNLVQLEKDKVVVLGFSIGGTIAWKAALKTLNVYQLIGVSSTRLRYEKEVPTCEIKLYFGENDPNKPNSKWLPNLNIHKTYWKNCEHNFYSERNYSQLICDAILKI